MSTKSKIVLSLVLTALASAVVFGMLSFVEARSSLREAAFDELTAIRTSRAAQVEDYFESVFDEANVITENPLVADAARRFSAGFRDIPGEVAPAQLEQDRRDLEAFYARRVLPNLTALLNEGAATYGGYGPKNPASVYLQDRYIAGRTNAQAGGPTAYEAAHVALHPELKFIVDEFEYYDIFLIDHESGDIVYTSRKEPDFATNIYTGPYRSSRLGEVVEQVENDPSQGAVYMSDFEFYAPSGGRPAIFVASGIYENDTLQGILAIQLTVDDLNAIMTADGEWEATGLKSTGETYLVGSDRLLRTESRFAVQDMDGYLEALDAAGEPDTVRAAIRDSGSAILRQRVDTDASDAALRGDTDTRVVADYRGVDVLSAYEPVRIKGHTFGLLAEIDAGEAFQPVCDLLTNIAITAALFVPLVALVGLVVAARLMAPLLGMRQTAREFLDGQEEAQFRDEGSNEWSQLGGTLNRLLDTTRARLADAKSSRAEVSEMTRTLMPRAIGERFMEGERKVVSAEGSASAAAFVLLPDPQLNDLANARASRDLYDELDDRLSALADREGVDLLNQAGMHYVAFCGLTAPIKNHAERLFRFCLAATRELDAFNLEHGTALDARVGFSSGLMFGAMIGSHAMAYEIWGPAIHTALDMAHAAGPGSMMLTADSEARIGRALATASETVDTLHGNPLEARRLDDLRSFARTAEGHGSATQGAAT